MKTIALLIFPLLFFISCSQVVQIEKRHYRSGFYLERKSDKEILSVNRQQDNVFERKINSTENHVVEIHLNAGQNQNMYSDSKTFSEKQKEFTKKTNNTKPISPKIKVPKGEPINKKAKAAVIFLLFAKLIFLAAFIVLLCSLVTVFFLLTGVAALFAILAIVFGLMAEKEIANETGIDKELGEKEAKFAVQRALGGLLVSALIIFLALFVDWLRGNQI